MTWKVGDESLRLRLNALYDTRFKMPQLKLRLHGVARPIELSVQVPGHKHTLFPAGNPRITRC